jgi:PAS domain S-box-containing protein
VAAIHQAGYPSVITVPLCIQDDLIGSLNLGLTRTADLTIEHMEVAREVGDQLAIGIRQVHLHQQVHQHAKNLERLVARRTASLEASEARFRAIFEQSAVGIALVNPRGYAILTNARLQKMLGYSEEELYEVRFPQVTHPEDRQRDQELFEELLGGERQEYVIEKRYIRRDGALIWGRLTVSIVRSPREEPRFIIAIIEDITAEKERHMALVQAEKLSTAGKLAASLAHEINNPLQSVIGCLGLAEEVMDEGEDASRYVEIALEELRRAARIVARLRDVQRAPGPGTREPTDINALIDQVLTLTHKEYENHGIGVRWETSERLPSLLTAPDRIKQVFLNLVLNALDAMAEGGELHIEATETEAPAGVRVTFSDTGPGIPPDVLPHIFDTFYTTKDKGMGLGLFISQDIIKHHGGTLEAHSELGQGAEFEVWLPLEGAAGDG